MTDTPTMKDGTCCFVRTLYEPSEWPGEATPSNRFRTGAGDAIELWLEPGGVVGFVYWSEGIEVCRARFGPIQLSATGRMLVIFGWNTQKKVWCHLNDTKLLPYSPDNPPAIFQPEGQVPPLTRVLPEFDPTALPPGVLLHFLQTLKELEHKMLEADDYGLVRASGLLRKLLLDDHPLLDRVNREARLRIRFDVVEIAAGVPDTPELHWERIDPHRVPGAPSLSLTKDQFLAHRCASVGHTEVSVKKISAHARTRRVESTTVKRRPRSKSSSRLTQECKKSASSRVAN